MNKLMIINPEIKILSDPKTFINNCHGALQPLGSFSRYDPEGQVAFRHFLEIEIEKLFAEVGMFPLRIIFPRKVNIAEKIKVIAVLLNLLQDPRIAGPVFEFAPDLGNDKLGITEQEPGDIPLKAVFRSQLSPGYFQDIITCIWPVQPADINPGILRDPEGPVVRCQPFRKERFARGFRAGNGNLYYFFSG